MLAEAEMLPHFILFKNYHISNYIIVEKLSYLVEGILILW
jgi:hypothetical protein